MRQTETSSAEKLSNGVLPQEGSEVIALRAILREPYGCRFCDSGKLRFPDTPGKEHDPECGYLLAERALGLLP